MKDAQVQQITYVIIFLGVALHLKTTFIESSAPGSVFSIGLLLWSIGPYLAIFILRKLLYGSLCAVVFVFTFDLLMHLEAFVFPSSSTASLGLLFMPLWNLIVVVPLSYFLGSIIAKKIKSKGTG